MENQKEHFNRQYIEFIIQNNYRVSPIKNRELRIHKSIQLEEDKNTNALNSLQSQQFVKDINLNKGIFFSEQILQAKKKTNKLSKIQEQRCTYGTEERDQKIINMIHKKNQEIAASLMKQKKSMSDVIYNNYSNASLYFAKKPSMKIYIQHQKQNRDRRTSYQHITQKSSNLPQIRNKKQKQKLKIEEEGREGKEDAEQFYHTKYQNQRKFQEIENEHIKKFLELRQEGSKYEPHIYFEEQQLKERKKKLYSQRKKIFQKQKQRDKNSLQQYLEAKIIPKQEEKPQEFDKNPKQSSRKETLQKDHPNSTQKLVSIKKNPKIGLNTKISNKFLFQDSEATPYEIKIKSIREFLFLLNISHGIFDPLALKDTTGNLKIEQKYKYFVGKGNNSKLIKALMKRRFWWVEVDDPKQANFAWTQLKNNYLYQFQRKSQMRDEIWQLEEQFKKRDKSKVNLPLKKSNLYKAPLPYLHEKILTEKIDSQYNFFLKSIKPLNSGSIIEQKYQNFKARLKYFPSLKNRTDTPLNSRVFNHLESNYLIGNKKALFYNLRQYYKLQGKNVTSIIPLTFHIGDGGTQSQSFKEFLKYFHEYKKNRNIRNIWIIKPGQNSNRGNGIRVLDSKYQIQKIIKRSNSEDDPKKTFIIQKYIEKPMLYKGRKFDIRHFMLATKMYGRMRLYWFGEGYIRTSSFDYDLEDIQDEMIHLTNDAIQKQAYQYGKHEDGNKISYNQLQRYFDFTFPNRKYSIPEQLYPQMKKIALDAFQASYLNMDVNNLEHNFELFGLDFMLDSSWNLYLIEVNTNPCLEMNCNILNKIIPTVVQHSLRVTIDLIFPQNTHYPNTLKHSVPDNPLDRLQCELIFDQGRDGKKINRIVKENIKKIQLENLEEDQQTYENDGKDIEIDIQ